MPKTDLLVSTGEAIARQAWLAGVRWAHGRRPTEETIADAFEAWWGHEHPSPPPVPGDASSWWYGHGSEAVGRLYNRHGPARRSAQRSALETLPLDGGYAPQLDPEERRRGQFRRVVVTSNGDVYTILSWWDGVRMDASACFIVRGDHAYASEAMLEAFPLHFPGQAIALAVVGVELEEAPEDP